MIGVLISVEEVSLAHPALEIVAHILQFICLSYLNFLPSFHWILFMNSADTHRLKDQERLKSDLPLIQKAKQQPFVINRPRVCIPFPH